MSDLLSLKVASSNKAERNPTWSRDELILALDLYFRVSPLSTNKENVEIRELSELLNALPIHLGQAKGCKFRNATGVYMKLCNFLRFDPSYQGAGLKRGAKLEEMIWKEFAADLPRLHRTAEAIKRNYQSLSPSGDDEEGDPEDEEFTEGKVLLKLHKVRERNATLVKKKKQRVLEKTGRLECEVCSFDFYKSYGELGYGFAECHHILPVSSLTPDHQTKLSDLVVICANCHRMLHRSREWLRPDDLKKLVCARSLSRKAASLRPD
jgi:5-methylcytosine-specific restriction protein A